MTHVRSVRAVIDGWLRALIELGVLVLVVASPWAFGSVEPEFEFPLYVGLGVLLVLWGVRTVLCNEFRWAKCPVATCLAALFLLGTLQIIPLPRTTLRWIAPRTAQLYDRLLPTQHETVRGVEEYTEYPMAGATLSLYGTATRRELLRLLAVFTLFGLVRNNCDGANSLRRLSIAALINATLLAYLGVAQFLSAPPNMLYWRIQSPGLVFGPFINRNHFAFYVNVCVGLGLGVLFWSSWQSQRTRLPIWRRFTDDPRLLWIIGAIALLVASSLFCLSRGGFIALIGAFLLCALLRRRTSPSPMRLEALLLLAGCLGLLGWFGMDRILTRYASLWTAPLANEARYALWRDSWKIARDFPLWGSGLGTFQYIEPLFRASVSDTLNEHAHNEYLESAVEGGLSRLALTLLLVVLMARIVYTAQRRHEGCSTEGLLLGALFGLATAVLHSVVEFGIHVPAIAVLLTVLAALVAQTGAIDQPGDAGAEVSHERELAAYTVRWHGMAPVLAAGMAIAVTWTLTASGWSRARVQILRRTATYWADQTGAAAEDRRIACLETAVQADPDLARLRLETAQSHLSVLQLKSARLEAEDSADEPAAAADLERLNREHLVPALTHYLFARDLCPVLGEPHLQIAAHIDLLEHADSRASYLDRAKLLSPHEPAVWYVSGLHALWDGDESKAWSEWRRALELSDEFLLEITGVSAAILEDQRLIAEVLPDRPELLVRVAFRRYPNAEQAEDRRPFLEKARSIMESLPATNAAAETRYMEGIIERALGNREAAMAAYQSALQISPAQTEWRYQLAELLVEAQRIEDAHRELVRILRQPGDHTRARILYEKVSRVRAETR